jgi:hypothetical protein
MLRIAVVRIPEKSSSEENRERMIMTDSKEIIIPYGLDRERKRDREIERERGREGERERGRERQWKSRPGRA